MKFYSINKSNLSKRLFELLGSTNDDNKLLIDTFKDGEMQPIFLESVRDEEVFILVDGHSSIDIVKCLLILDALKRADCRYVNIIFPYLPYSRQDKLKDGIRSSLSIRVLADILESIGFDRIITIELHNLTIKAVYSQPMVDLNGNKIFIDYLKSLNLSDLCVCAPDSGASPRNKNLAKYFPNSLSALFEKTRKKPNEIDSLLLIGEENVKNRNILMIDDILDTGKTSVKSINYLHTKGVKSVIVCITHFVASENALENIYNSAINELVISDTVYGTEEKVKLYNETYTTPNHFGFIPKITIISCADFLAETINRLNNHKSISEIN